MTMRNRIVLSAVLSSLILVAGAAYAQTLADPVTFSIKRTFSGTTIGLPMELGGALFSADGNTLYVVANADRTGSDAVFAVPVIRDGGTQEIIDLGPAASVVKLFDGDSVAGGLDAGLDFGPGGTLFYYYWLPNTLAQRPGGFAGAETQFLLTDIGVPVSGGGITFSPFRCDANTQFGQLQVSVYDGDNDSDPTTGPRNIYDVTLSAGVGGLYTPLDSTLFAGLPPGTPELPIGSPTGMHYIPSGSLAGNLLYASWDVGQVRYLMIDQASGLPIDAGSNQPQLGTVNPVDQLFASDMGEGPLGMDFDPITHDLFLTTAQGIPFNSILQIGGFEGTAITPVDCTAVTTTTISSTTTSTTLPPCAPDLTTDALGCRIDRLSTDLAVVAAPGKSLDASQGKLDKATERLSLADTAIVEGNTKKARKQLGKAAKFVRSVDKKLASPKKGPKLVPDATARAAVEAAAAALVADLLAFRDTF